MRDVNTHLSNKTTYHCKMTKHSPWNASDTSNAFKGMVRQETWQRTLTELTEGRWIEIRELVGSNDTRKPPIRWFMKATANI